MQLDSGHVSTGPGERLRVLQAALALLNELANHQPLALLLDDLHCADSGSLALLVHLARGLRGQPILLLGTYRDGQLDGRHPLAAAVADLTRDHLVDEIALRRFTPEATAALVGSRLGTLDIPRELLTLLDSRASGNPFFIEALLKACIEQDLVYREHDRWNMKDLSAFGLPRSVRAVVRQRAGHLPSSARKLLDLASVLGQEFDLDVLIEASHESEDVVTAQAYGAWAEAVACANSRDAEAALDEAEALASHSDHRGAWPQIARARALWRTSHGDLPRAEATVRESIRLAREQGACIQLARSLATLRDLQSHGGDLGAAANTGHELQALVQTIGHEVSGLVWAHGLRDGPTVTSRHRIEPI